MISAMASKLCITAALLLLAVPNFGTGASTINLYGQTGGSITLIPNVTEVVPLEILWKHNKNKAVEFDKKFEEFGQFKGRTRLDTKTGQLTITQLMEMDSGQYQVELDIGGQLHENYYEVKIIDAVTTLTVTCENINSSTVTLRCAGDQSPLTEYSWVGPGIQNKPGSELQLNNEDIQSSDAVYTCVVKNPVSEKRSDFYVKTCSASQVNIAEIAGGVIGVILLLVIIAGVCFCCWRKRNQEGSSIGTCNEDKNERVHLTEPPKMPEGSDGDDQQPGHVKKTVQQFGGPGKWIMSPSKPIDEDKDETEPLIEAQKTADGGAALPLDERQAGSSIGTCNEDKNERVHLTEPPKMPEGSDGDDQQPGHVKKTVQQFGGPGKRIMSPNKPIDEDKDETEPLIEAQKTADGGAALPLDERQAGSSIGTCNEDKNDRVHLTEQPKMPEGSDGDDQQPGHVKKSVQQFGGPGKWIMSPNKPIDEDKDETEPLIEAQKTADGGAALPLDERQAGSSIGTCNEDKNDRVHLTEQPKMPEGSDGDDQQPGHVKKSVQQFGGPGKWIMSPNKPIDEDKDETEPLIEAQKTADGGAALPLDERQAGSSIGTCNEDKNDRVHLTEQPKMPEGSDGDDQQPGHVKKSVQQFGGPGKWIMSPNKPIDEDKDETEPLIEAQKTADGGAALPLDERQAGSSIGTCNEDKNERVHLTEPPKMPEGSDGDDQQPGHVKKSVQQFGGPGKWIMSPNKPIDEDKDETEPLIEAQKTADGGAALPLEERQAGSSIGTCNEDKNERVHLTEPPKMPEGSDGDDQQPGHVKKTVQQFGGPGKRIMSPNNPIDEDKDETEPLIEAQKTADGGAALPLEERQAGSSIGTCNEDKNERVHLTEPPKMPEGSDGDDQQPGYVKKTVQQFGGPGKRIMSPNKPIDEDKDETEPLIEAQKTADGGAALPLEERQAESFSNLSGGFSPKSPTSGSLPLSLPCSSPACTPETGKGVDVESKENGGSEDNPIPDLKNQSPPSVQSEAVEREDNDLAPPLLVSSTEQSEIQDPNLHTTKGSPADTKEDQQKCSTSPAMPDGDQVNSEIQDTGAEHSEERQEEGGN